MIVITGGAGFIGSCLLKYLNDRGRDDILIVDNLNTSDKWKNLLGKNFIDYIPKFEFINFINEIEESNLIEAIFHLGACSSTTEKDMDYLYDNNYNFSKDLASFAIENDIKFIYASSAATYGMGENGFDDNEFNNLSPMNGYGYSKYLFDRWLVKMGLNSIFTGFKFFNVFGPNEYHKDGMTSMVYKSFQQITESGKVKLYKSNEDNLLDGEQKRDFIYVKDICEVMLEAFDKELPGIFNLGTGEANSWNKLVNNVFDALDLNSSIEYIEMPEYLSKQYQNFTQANMSKFRKAGFKTEFTSLKDSVNDYVQNYLMNGVKYL
ncbi:MAG: ADP-glyceromanno-heptose 6-epimerase [Ignavibacteriae bacterium]|nr:ADP-glyceromanno-heptose 6-epimerase [Ignavibacteriota bacterium]MCB9220667.1 ADP-glyceromanno-heptose 6-epimerase [Ignavibacteria bacterium]